MKINFPSIMSQRFRGRLWLAQQVLDQRWSFWRQRHKEPDPERILIVHHLLLGDTLMLTPLLAKLRARYPTARLFMALPEAYAPLYQGLPYGVEVLPWNPRKIETFLALQRRSTRGYDWAFVPGDNRHSWLAAALGARWIIAQPGDHPGYKNWLIDEWAPPPIHPQTWGDYLASWISGPAPGPYQSWDWPAPPCANFSMPTQPYAVLHLGASSPLKQWMSRNWRGLASWLENQGLVPVWTGGPGEEALAKHVDRSQRYRSYIGQLNLAQMWRLLAEAQLLVAPDTGIAHLGRLTDTPTVTLFGPGSATICGAGTFWANSPYRAVTVDSFPCRDQPILFRRTIAWVKRCGRSPGKALGQCAKPKCMQAITLEAVQSAIHQLLVESRP